MLPAHLAENICKQVLFYLQSTFDKSPGGWLAVIGSGSDLL